MASSLSPRIKTVSIRRCRRHLRLIDPAPRVWFHVVEEEGEHGRQHPRRVESVSATINVPIDKVDIASWCFALRESEYQSCSPAHCSAGATTAPDGRRMDAALRQEHRTSRIGSELGAPIMAHAIYDRQSTALLVIDPYNDFISGGRQSLGSVEGRRRSQ